MAFAVYTHKLRMPEVGAVTVEFQLQYFVDTRHSNRSSCSRIIFWIQDTVTIYCSGIFLVQDTVTRYLLLKTICFAICCWVILSAVFCGCYVEFYALLFVISPFFVFITWQTVTRTRTIIITIKWLGQQKVFFVSFFPPTKA